MFRFQSPGGIFLKSFHKFESVRTSCPFRSLSCPNKFKYLIIMKILHTADWHLGQTFFGYERVEEHQAFLDWLRKQEV